MSNPEKQDNFTTTGEPEYCTEDNCPCDNGEIKNNDPEE